VGGDDATVHRVTRRHGDDGDGGRATIDAMAAMTIGRRRRSRYWSATYGGGDDDTGACAILVFGS
jgi:hypothetical protein